MFHHLVVRLRLAAQADPKLVDAAEFFFLHGEGGLFPEASPSPSPPGSIPRSPKPAAAGGVPGSELRSSGRVGDESCSSYSPSPLEDNAER
jgi:hypothetical protein